ncbi:MAG: recombinase family protein [Mycobacteriales bacterium]
MRPEEPSTYPFAYPSAIRQAYDLLRAGAGPDSIARTWNAAGLPAPSGRRGEWTAEMVRAELTSHAHIGGDDAVLPALTEPPAAVAPDPEDALLTAVAVCGVCGGPVRTERLPADLPAYRCDADGGHLSRSMGPVDSWVRLRALDRLGRPDTAQLVADPDRPDLYALRAHAAGLRTRRSQLEQAAATGAVEPSTATAGADRLRVELAAVEDQMVDHSRRNVPASLTGADPLDAAWDRLGTARQRGVLLALAERVVLHPVTAGQRAGDADVLRDTVVITWRPEPAVT